MTPQAACTVILRYLDPPDVTWDYSTACQTALDLGLTTDTAVNHVEVTRGDLAVMLYRALGHTALDVPEASELGVGLSRNSDGSINLPSDGSQYVPQVGDVIRCDDGTNYTITDVHVCLRTHRPPARANLRLEPARPARIACNGGAPFSE